MFTSVQVSCLTLTAMTIDRYTAILYPLRSLNFRTTKLAFVTNIFIWIGN
jgi:KISS1 receptor